MKIGGFIKFSLIDYPGKISCIIFTQGCNFKCCYCHNPQLVLPELFTNPLNNKKILEFLEKRKNQIQGVVISGGEPTLQQDLPSFLKKIKKIGYLIKLDTNGSNPKMIKTLINSELVDYIAMDIKTSLNKYHNIINSNFNKNNILESINLISNIKHEFRTTIIKGIIEEKEIKLILPLINKTKKYIIKQISNVQTLNKKKYTIFSLKELLILKNNLSHFNNIQINL